MSTLLTATDFERMLTPMSHHKLYNPARDARVLEMRFMQHMTFRAIGTTLGLSLERIRQIVAVSLRYLRHRPYKLLPDDFLLLLAHDEIRQALWADCPPDIIKLQRYVRPKLNEAVARITAHNSQNGY